MVQYCIFGWGKAPPKVVESYNHFFIGKTLFFSLFGLWEPHLRFYHKLHNICWVFWWGLAPLKVLEPYNHSPHRTDHIFQYFRKLSGAPWKNDPMTPKLWPWPILIILHDICVAIPDSTKIYQKSEKIDQKNEWGPMKKWS